MSKKKALPDNVGDFFEGESIFFPPVPQQPAPPQPQKQHKARADLVSPTSGTNEHEASRQQTRPQPSPLSPQEEERTKNELRRRDGVVDVTHDVTTSQLQGINLKEWQEIIEDTETQNSALRLTSEERYAIEDVVNELRRKYGVKTSMNEVARLGLLVLIEDFKKNKKESIIYKVKKA